jgi:histidinol-phosphate aminotransferase
VLERCFVLHSPNKALGLCGVRAAYAIAPRAAGYDLERCCRALRAAAPSWPLSAQGDALLRSWASAPTQAWLQHSRATLTAWKHALQHALAARGFVARPSVTPFFVVQPPRAIDAAWLRAAGITLRDTTSFGLPGGWRISAQPAEAQHALLRALDTMPP